MRLGLLRSMSGLRTLAPYLISVTLLVSLSAAQESTSTASSSATERTPLVVILLDGFRWDYLNYLDSNAQGFTEFLNGASAKYVTTIFPSTSYPAWTTISTGLYPENHGIIANFFLNRQRKAEFALTNRTTTRKAYWWQSPEPIWTTATRSGRHTATILWSRSEVYVRGVLPEEAQGYEQRPDTLAELQSTLIRTLEYLGRGFDFVMAYNEHLDVIGHEYGPDSNDMKIAINEVDRYLAQFFAGMKNRTMYPKVNVILLSDHGMARAAHSKAVIDLQSILGNEADVENAYPQGPFVAVYARPGRVENIMYNLRKIKGISAYRRGEVPEEFHYNKHPWLPDIIICAHKGYSIKTSLFTKESGPAGQHGYSPKEEDMRTIFLATGPDFKTNTIGGPIELVDEYQIFCHLLQIRAKPHNGTWDHVRHLLKGDPTHPFGEEPPLPTEPRTIGESSPVATSPSTSVPVPVSTSPPESVPSVPIPAPSVPAPVRRPAEEAPQTRNEILHVAAERPPANRRQSSSAVCHTSQRFLTLLITVSGWYFARYF